MIHFGILETGRSRDYLTERHGTFAEMFEHWLGGRRPGLDFSAYAVHEDDFPAAVDECHAWLITGSPAGVYEDHAWIPRLEAFIRDAAEARVPQVGICFGHQVIATALGGKVVKSERGWGIGTHVAEIVEEADWMQPAAGTLALHVTHQDQVVEPPDGAVVVASSEFCPVSALLYADRRAVSFQGHPEHTTEFARDLIDLRRTQGVDEAVARCAEDSLATATDEDLLAEWVLRFVAGRG